MSASMTACRRAVVSREGRGARVSWWSSDDPRRRAAFVAAMLAGSAIAGLGAGSLLSAGGRRVHRVEGQPARRRPRPRHPVTFGDNQCPEAAASEIERGTTSDIGYFLGTRSEKDGTHVTFDRVLLLRARTPRPTRRPISKKKPKKDGVLLVNDNDLTRDLVLAPDVKVQGAQPARRIARPGSQCPWQTLLDAVASQGAGAAAGPDLRQARLRHQGAGARSARSSDRVSSKKSGESVQPADPCSWVMVRRRHRKCHPGPQEPQRRETFGEGHQWVRRLLHRHEPTRACTRCTP